MRKIVPAVRTSTWVPGNRKQKMHGNFNAFPLWALWRVLLPSVNNPHSHLKHSLKNIKIPRWVCFIQGALPPKSFDEMVTLLNRSLKITKAPQAWGWDITGIKNDTYFEMEGLSSSEWQLLTPLAETEPTMIALATIFMPLILLLWLMTRK